MKKGRWNSRRIGAELATRGYSIVDASTTVYGPTDEELRAEALRQFMAPAPAEAGEPVFRGELGRFDGVRIFGFDEIAPLTPKAWANLRILDAEQLRREYPPNPTPDRLVADLIEAAERLRELVPPPSELEVTAGELETLRQLCTVPLQPGDPGYGAPPSLMGIRLVVKE